MKQLIIILTIIQTIQSDGFSSTLGHIKTKASPQTQTKAVNNLIIRTISYRANQFLVKIDPDAFKSTKDAFKIESLPVGTISITGTTGVAAASAFNHYLKYFCHCHISWETAQLNLPAVLPQVNITIPFNDRFRYYQNVCTTSYSFVWWDWKQWEKHIDWMVLNGFNLVLAFNGQEAIWERVYRKFNLTETDIGEHFTGPAFLSWLRMGNMRGFGGPLSEAWHTKSIILQKNILERLRSFGVITVLPAFAGHLPKAFKRLYPNANMVPTAKWDRFNETYCCPYFLEPTEDLFNALGRAFMDEQIREFGTDHMYNCDSFNEVQPSTGDLTYLANVGRAIYKALTDSDSKAIWVMQSWLFFSDAIFWTNNRAKALLTSVPQGKMIVLDLQSEQFPQYGRYNQYFGQPYIWCMLHNFGGTLGMLGSAAIINRVPLEARAETNSTMIGTGLTPEGINQNYVIYELMTETAWRKDPVDLTQWVGEYTHRRYRFQDENAEKAWGTLIKTVYNYDGLVRMHGKYSINKKPNLKDNIWSWYSTTDLISAWNYLIQASPTVGTNTGYIHDLVDVTRQVLQVQGDHFYTQLRSSYEDKNVDAFRGNVTIFLGIFEDLEAILGTDEAFLLGPWLESSKKAASSTEEAKQFEWNARNQITLWGPTGEIMDYASKQWSGVVSHFFAPRWLMYINYLDNVLSNKTRFNQTLIADRIFKAVEEPFTLDQHNFPVKPSGNAIEVARTLYKKWARDYGKV